MAMRIICTTRMHLLLYSADVMVDVITPQQFPKLNTSNFCFLSPLLCRMFPNDGIVLSIAAAAAPLISINSSGVSHSANTTINFSAQSPLPLHSLHS
jgi:hypothetical protein